MLFRIHKEGQTLIGLIGLSLLLLNVALWIMAPLLFWPVVVLSAILFVLVLQFFRNPPRPIPVRDNQLIYAPADGRTGRSALDAFAGVPVIGHGMVPIRCEAGPTRRGT